jgi:hypothetical protein
VLILRSSDQVPEKSARVSAGTGIAGTAVCANTTDTENTKDTKGPKQTEGAKDAEETRGETGYFMAEVNTTPSAILFHEMGKQGDVKKARQRAAPHDRHYNRSQWSSP